MAIPNPADFSAIRPKLAQAKEKVVVWCGRLDFSPKRLDRMLRIWRQVSAQYPDWQLKVLGSGNWDYWKSLVQSHHLKNVEIVGFCNPNPYYERASIVCMTSTTEGWGMVLIEGQVHGCAVMAYDSYASVSDIITDGENGVIVPAFNECEYARRLSKLMEDDALRQRMAQNGTQSVRRFASTNIAKRWISEFEQW
jgi:glycosyltransferase involved in cell wall biosynthesis